MSDQEGGELVHVQRAAQRLEQRRIALGLLHGDGLVEKAALLEIVAQHALQVDVVDRQLAVLTGQYPFQEGEVLANLQFVLRGIVEDPEADLVAQALAGKEGLAGDLLGDLVEAIL